MGKKLDELISKQVEAIFASFPTSNQYTEETRTEAMDALAQKWKQKVRQEVIDELTADEKAKIDTEVKAHKNKAEIENLWTLVRESLFLAFIVGILVNQATDLITYYKDGEFKLLITWIAVILLGAVVCVYVLFRLASTISKLLDK